MRFLVFFFLLLAMCAIFFSAITGAEKHVPDAAEQKRIADCNNLCYFNENQPVCATTIFKGALLFRTFKNYCSLEIHNCINGSGMRKARILLTRNNNFFIILFFSVYQNTFNTIYCKKIV